MKNNKIAAFLLSTALVIPAMIASTSNPADAKPTKQEAQKVLQILNKVNNSSENSAFTKSGSVRFSHTPGAQAGVNISHSEKKLISKFLDQANCLVQTGGLNPKTGFPVTTPRLSCAGTSFKRYTQQRFWVDNGYAKLFYTNGLTFDYYQNQIGLQQFLTQIRRVANGTRWL
jgi:hypothetical protein